MSNVIELNDYRQGWGVVRETCNACGYSCIGCVHESADLTRLECAKCGAQDSRATWICDWHEPPEK